MYARHSIIATSCPITFLVWEQNDSNQSIISTLVGSHSTSSEKELSKQYREVIFRSLNYSTIVTKIKLNLVEVLNEPNLNGTKSR
jgi:hypothetical protein